MRRLTRTFLTSLILLIPSLGIAQNDTDIIAYSVDQIEKTEISADNYYLQGKFLEIVRSGGFEEIIGAYQENGFKRFTKMIYIGNYRDSYSVVESEDDLVLLLNEIKTGIPKKMESDPTETVEEELVDLFVTDRWEYVNPDGYKCKIEVYFLNGQLRNIGYWIYK